MKSIKDIYKIGKGPSSSHTMGPAKAMSIFVSEHPEAEAYEVVLYGSLADTGRVHGTDRALEGATEKPVSIIFNTENKDIPHENTMYIYSVVGGKRSDTPMRVMSVGGGDIRIEGREESSAEDIYPETTFAEIAELCKGQGIRLSDYVVMREGEEIYSFLYDVWEVVRPSWTALQPPEYFPEASELSARLSIFTISVTSTKAPSRAKTALSAPMHTPSVSRTHPSEL